ncbi:MAG: Nramp family divalent metal transporter [Candidatus Omnitrophica bacterium]|nr:Nramp family divalent metal transporter [Candidatus Omnitrophota bacterium]
MNSKASIHIPAGAGFWRKLFAFMGPGLLIAVGYIDPGNWATDISAGAKYGYQLLFIVLLSNFLAMLFQYLSLKLGIASGRDLAQACRDRYSKPVVIFLWLLCEVAIIACDLAEVIGSAIALNLLFGMPLIVGVMITALDVIVILAVQSKGFRYLEALVAGLMFVIGAAFVYEILAAHPQWLGVAAGFIPTPKVIVDPGMLYVAIGIIGATVMPHNLYLHSSIVQTRAFDRDDAGKSMAVKYATIDVVSALTIAFFINAAILVLSAAAFHGTGNQNVADINDAYHLLTPILGASMASMLFAVALLASGQSSTLTGTLAGQIVMEGFLDLRIRPWVRRIITRLVAVIPAVGVAAWVGAKGLGQLLVLTQVILSFQLAFAVVPLVVFTSDKRFMGRFTNCIWLKVSGWLAAILIIGLNLLLIGQVVALCTRKF